MDKALCGSIKHTAPASATHKTGRPDPLHLFHNTCKHACCKFRCSAANVLQPGFRYSSCVLLLTAVWLWCTSPTCNAACKAEVLSNNNQSILCAGHITTNPCCTYYVGNNPRARTLPRTNPTTPSRECTAVTLRQYRPPFWQHCRNLAPKASKAAAALQCKERTRCKPLSMQDPQCVNPTCIHSHPHTPLRQRRK